MEATPVRTAAATLKPYDIRQERDRARRRHLRQATRRTLRVATLGLLDVLALGAALGLACALTGATTAHAQLLAAPVLSVLLLSLLVVNAYGPGSFRTDAGARLKGVLLGSGILLAQALLTSWPALTPGLVLVFAPLAALLVEGERTAVDKAVRAARARGHLVRPALVVASPDEAEALARQLLGHPLSDLRVVGRIAWEPEEAGASPEGALPTMGTAGALQEVVQRHDVRVVVLGASVPAARAPELVALAFDAGASVLPIPSAGQRAAAHLGAVASLHLTTLEVAPPRLELPKLWAKRTLDLALTVPALVVLSPVFLLIALAVRLDSRGPALFRQTRVGVGGRPFTLLKLRTMVADAEARRAEVAHLNQYGDPRLFKAADDPRVTRLGRFLRRTSLDELPQLLNVLKGEMSLVGPRPPLPEEVVRYHEEHLVRLAVVPGLTGPWQAGGRSEVLDFDEVVRLERDYIRDWSLWLDLRILARTLVAVARGEGAR